MKKKIFAFSIAVLISSTSFGGCIGPKVIGNCLGVEVNGVDGSSSEQDSFESSSGARYQYDRNNPIDQNSYSLDLDAQRRDQMSADPRRNTDRNSGQYGGGIYND